MIGHGRVVFTDAMQSADLIGVFSVEANGWVTQWRTDNPEVVHTMFPPQSILCVHFNDADGAS